MTFAIFSVVIAVGWAAITTWLLRAQARDHKEAQAQWALERRELLNRIQAPERIPMTERPELVVPDREPDEWAQVGQIDIDPEYGLEEN